MDEKLPTHAIVTCFHCGEDCEGVYIGVDEQNFCSKGCKLGYEVLSDNELGTYYDIANHPGESQKRNKRHSNRFDFCRR